MSSQLPWFPSRLGRDQGSSYAFKSTYDNRLDDGFSLCVLAVGVLWAGCASVAPPQDFPRGRALLWLQPTDSELVGCMLPWLVPAMPWHGNPSSPHVAEHRALDARLPSDAWRSGRRGPGGKGCGQGQPCRVVLSLRVWSVGRMWGDTEDVTRSPVSPRSRSAMTRVKGDAAPIPSLSEALSALQ